MIRWIDSLSRIGVHLPGRIGVLGPASIKTLLRYAQDCGVGPSMRVVARQARTLAKPLSVLAPDVLLAGLAAFQAADPERRLRGVHLFPIGGFAKTCTWFAAVAGARFILARDGKDFSLAEPLASAAS